jgi:RimJ/RimL family protein N-acetyltransferase
MIRTLNHAKELYGEYGVTVTVLRAMRKMMRWVFDTNSAYWLERDLSVPIPEVKPRIPVEINLFAKEETIEWFKKQKEKWIYNRHEIETAKKARHIFPNLKYKGEIIGYVKGGAERVYIEDYRKEIALPAHTGFCYDYFICPEYRGKNLSLFMTIETMKFVRRLGIKKIIVHIPPWNTASLKVSKRLGFVVKKYVRHFRIFGLIKIWHSRKIKNEEII